MQVKRTLALVALVVMACSGMAAAATPKPWQWPATKVVTKLRASSPIVSGDSDAAIVSSRCTPRGKGIAGRYSRFVCVAQWAQGNYTATLTLRILAVGSGKLCVVTTTSAAGNLVAVPYASGTQGTKIVPSRACPS